MRPRRHHRTNVFGKAFQHAGIWVTILFVAVLLAALALGGPSPRY
jgi:hypothetical protein